MRSTHMRDTAQHPSPSVISLANGVMAVATVVFAAFALVVLLGRLLGVSFTAIAILTAAMIPCVIALALRRLRHVVAAWTRHDSAIASLLLVLAVACGIRSLVINAPEEDDGMYVPPAVHALTHPDRPLTMDLA